MPMEGKLTEGNLFCTILQFSLPFLFANLLQALYGATDLFMVGQFADAVAVSAVATGSQIMQTITGLAIGLTTGGTILIGQYYGAQKRQQVFNAIKTILILFAILAMLMTAATIFTLSPICTLMQVPEQALTATKSYLLICAWGIPFIIGYNAVSGILRGLGNSKTPLLFIAISCGINIISDFIFVAILQMGATGAAISTVFAQGLGLIFIFLYLAGKKLLQKYNISQPQFSIISAHKILLAGIPIALQEGLVNASFLVITAIINHLGLIASAAVGVAEKLILFSMLPTTAFASAIAAITAQHHGAGLIKRGRQCLYTGLAIALVFGIACFLLAQQYAPFFMGIFTKDQAVIQAGAAYLHSYSLDCIIVCFVFCLNTYFSGSGHPIFPLVHSIISTCLVRIPLSWLLSLQPEASLFQIGMAAPAASLLSLLLCQYYLWRTKKQLSFPQ